MSVYVCEEEDWAMVVMNCHREKEHGAKLYSERVTGVSLRWGNTYYHTQYDYFHSSHRGHRSWKIQSDSKYEESNGVEPATENHSVKPSQAKEHGSTYDKTFSSALKKSQTRRRRSTSKHPVKDDNDVENVKIYESSDIGGAGRKVDSDTVPSTPEMLPGSLPL